MRSARYTASEVKPPAVTSKSHFVSTDRPTTDIGSPANTAYDVMVPTASPQARRHGALFRPGNRKMTTASSKKTHKHRLV